MNIDPSHTKRELLARFIETYKYLPCLWRIKSKEYYDKGKKDAAYNILLEQYKLIDPNADRETVAKKINILRTNYRRQKKKIEDCKRSGTEILKPILWYYHLFDFLEEQENFRKASYNFHPREVSDLFFVEKII